MRCQAALEWVFEIRPQGLASIALRATADQKEQEDTDENYLQPESSFLASGRHRHKVALLCFQGGQILAAWLRAQGRIPAWLTLSSE
jgi:hypothetical protein